MLSEEDKNLFRQAVESNTPIDKDSENKLADGKNRPLFEDFIYVSRASFSGAEIVKYAKSGTNKKLIKKMQQGNIGQPPALDLHGQTLAEACHSMAQFLHQQQRQKFIQIIHGKGYHSDNSMSILKTQVVQFLKKHPAVLAFNSCPDRLGGTGAVFVLLRK
ncbi:MAG: hypothetical protein HAW58_03135 [Candidatus Thioglobus sp.]|nr:hypothetical protein [Candidatus Thioglobus sp.]